MTMKKFTVAEAIIIFGALESFSQINPKLAGVIKSAQDKLEGNIKFGKVGRKRLGKDADIDVLRARAVANSEANRQGATPLHIEYLQALAAVGEDIARISPESPDSDEASESLRKNVSENGQLLLSRLFPKNMTTLASLEKSVIAGRKKLREDSKPSEKLDPN